MDEIVFRCRFPLALSRFSARFEELDNRLFLLAGREYYLQVGGGGERGGAIDWMDLLLVE